MPKARDLLIAALAVFLFTDLVRTECLPLTWPPPAEQPKISLITTSAPTPQLPSSELAAVIAQAGHKVPRLIAFRNSLPRSPSGKVLRHRL